MTLKLSHITLEINVEISWLEWLPAYRESVTVTLS